MSKAEDIKDRGLKLMAESRSVTIEHVAEMAGVSRQTVSRVINNSPNVKPAVKERIQEAIDALGYVPNIAARRMGGAKSFLIVAINDRQRTIENWRAGHGNDWVDQMLYGGMTVAEAHGYHMLFELVDTDPDAAIVQLDKIIASLRPDGIVLTPPHSQNEALVELLARRKIGCARINVPNSFAGITVRMDDTAAAREATEHLIDLGHRRIAYLSGGRQYAVCADRLRGYTDAMQAAGLPCHPDWVREGGFLFDPASAQTDELLVMEQRPTAIIADNDEMAFATLHAIDRAGLQVPGDVSIISFEDTPGVRFSVPPLTAVRQPTSDIIGAAVERLIARANGDDVDGIFTLPHVLRVRGTTCSPK